MRSVPYTLRAVARQDPSSPRWLRDDALVEVGSVLAEDARAALQGLQAGQGRPALPKLQPGRRYLLRVGDLAVSLDGGEPGDLARTAEHAAAHARDHADQAYGKKIPTRPGPGAPPATIDVGAADLWFCEHVIPRYDRLLAADPAVKIDPRRNLYVCRTCGHAPAVDPRPPNGRPIGKVIGGLKP